MKNQKQKMITRTMSVSTVTYMTVDVTTATVANHTATIVGSHSTDTALSELRRTRETETIKVVSVINVMTEEALYGITEGEFLAHAVKLPPRSAVDVE